MNKRKTNFLVKKLIIKLTVLSKLQEIHRIKKRKILLFNIYIGESKHSHQYKT